MTTTSANAGYIDYAAFGLDAEDIRSLKSLAPTWRASLVAAAQRFGVDGGLADFIEQSAGLTESIADPDWQAGWMRAWHKLNSEGFAISDMFSLFNYAVACSEVELLGMEGPVSRVQLTLFAILRRSVVAAVSCAIELGEQMRTVDAGMPGEQAVLSCVQELAAEGRSIALLAVTLGNRRAFSHLAASELECLPGLLAEQLSSLLRPQDMVYAGREGEWLLVLPDVQSMAQPVLAASHIKRAFEDPVVLLSGRGLLLDVEIGAAMLPDHATQAQDLIQNARLARASLQGEDESFAMFDDALRQAWLSRYELSSILHDVLQREELMLFMQPQVDAVTGQCFGAELLVRWCGTDGRWVSPPLIMEMVEENGWRGTYTEWLVRSALRLSSRLQDAGIDIRLSLNLTAGDLQDDDLPDLVAQCLETWRIPGSRFTFELIESAMLRNRERTLKNMHRLKDLGIKLALDDFGTGYSSLSYLATLPLNEIKIDRSFIVGMLQSPDKLRVVRTIVDLTCDLGMTPLAEGVEDEAQRSCLLSLGCQQIQGFLYGMPMPVDKFIAWYRARQA